MNGWMNVCMDECMYVCISAYTGRMYAYSSPIYVCMRSMHKFGSHSFLTCVSLAEPALGFPFMASADILIVENESNADPTTHGIRVSSLIMETISSSHEVKRRKVTHEAEYQVNYIYINRFNYNHV